VSAANFRSSRLARSSNSTVQKGAAGFGSRGVILSVAGQGPVQVRRESSAWPDVQAGRARCRYPRSRPDASPGLGGRKSFWAARSAWQVYRASLQLNWECERRASNTSYALSYTVYTILVQSNRGPGFDTGSFRSLRGGLS